MTLVDVNRDTISVLVRDLYEIFLNREPDPEGLRHYVERLESGAAVSDIIKVFITSEEYELKQRSKFLRQISAVWSREPAASPKVEQADPPRPPSERFPSDYVPPGEAGRSYPERLRSGFLDRYCSGPIVLDVGFAGYDNPQRKVALPHAIGIDLDYPNYDGVILPFEDQSVDTVFASHCLEHIQFDHAVIRDWFRVLKVGGFIVCMVPSQALYEKKRFLPSRFNADHKRMYTPASLASSFETALEVNTYRLRQLVENDRGYNYSIGPDQHSEGAYEIEIVIEKINPPLWKLE